MNNNSASKYNSASFRLTRLYRKTSAKGATYFAGRLGGAKVALLRSRDTAEDGGEIWDLLISEAPPPRQNGQGGPQRQPAADDGRRDWQAPAARQAGPATPVENGDEIPF